MHNLDLLPVPRGGAPVFSGAPTDEAVDPLHDGDEVFEWSTHAGWPVLERFEDAFAAGE